MSTFGWCLDGNCAPGSDSQSPGCPAVLPEMKWPDPARKGATITLPERRCDHPCHQRPSTLRGEPTREAPQ